MKSFFKRLVESFASYVPDSPKIKGAHGRTQDAPKHEHHKRKARKLQKLDKILHRGKFSRTNRYLKDPAAKP